MKKGKMALLMILVCFVCFLSACGSESSKESDQFSDIGITISLPDEYKNSVGTIDMYSSDIS